MTFSTTLTLIVLILLLIDLIYRIKFPRVTPTSGVSQQDSALKEFFRDHKSQLSFTRLSIAFLLVFGFGVVIYGILHKELWVQCQSVWDKILDASKNLFIIGKAPETVSQLQGVFGNQGSPKDGK